MSSPVEGTKNINSSLFLYNLLPLWHAKPSIRNMPGICYGGAAILVSGLDRTVNVFNYLASRMTGIT